MKKVKTVNQKPKKEIASRLKELGIYELWKAALDGNLESQKKLSQLSLANKEIREGLELIKPRRNLKKKKTPRNTCAMESSKIYATGWITIYRG